MCKFITCVQRDKHKRLMRVHVYEVVNQEFEDRGLILARDIIQAIYLRNQNDYFTALLKNREIFTSFNSQVKVGLLLGTKFLTTKQGSGVKDNLLELPDCTCFR